MSIVSGAADAAAVAGAFTRHVDAGHLDLPLPGQGRTRARWAGLSAIAEQDLCVARLCEGHADAVAILSELDGPTVEPGTRWGVWAAAPNLLHGVRAGEGWRVSGRKPYCSGASTLTHALVTARCDDGVRLFALDCAQPGVAARAGTWPAVGMAASDSLDVDLDDAAVHPVGDPGRYVERPGFWHGGMGVAACWYGGARGVAALLAERVGKDQRENPYAAAHLGALDAGFAAADALLQVTATLVDDDPRDATGAARQAAMRLRAVCERLATEAVDRVGRALGAGPLSHNAAHAHRVADLPVYVRQSHAEHDLASLAELSTERGWDWALPSTPAASSASSSPPGDAAPDSIRRAGTPEELWQRRPGWTRIPILDLDSCARLVVVAAHPDDEVLGVGGLMSLAAGRGIPVRLIAVTDGEGSHPDSSTIAPTELATARLEETERAFAELGVAPRITRLGLPDSAVAGHEQAVAARVADVLRSGDWCVATWESDRHPDHEATGRAATAAARGAGVRMLQVPIWAWHWARPEGDLPWHAAYRVPLDPVTFARKVRAIAAFGSQIARRSELPGDAAILPAHVLAHFLRADEVLFG